MTPTDVQPGTPPLDHAALNWADDESLELPSTSHISIVDADGSALSMTTTIVMQDGAPVLVVGSPGGSRIIGYVAKTIIAHLDLGMDLQQTVALPQLVNRFGTYDVEAGTSAESLTEALTSGLHVIAVGETLEGGADPRREGVTIGQ